MPRHLISDAHEWSNEIPTVPTGGLANLQPRERAWEPQRGKKTLLSLTLVRPARPCARRSEVGDLQDHWRVRRARAAGLMGSLAGAARLLDHNAGVQRRAQGGRKPPVAHKGKCLPERAACAACSGNGGLDDLRAL